MEKSTDERVYVMSGPGFTDITHPDGGKNYYWTTEKNVEMPIH